MARALVAALVAAPRAGLSGVASPRLALILGERARLPWVDGVQYLGRDPSAPRLLLPTTHEPVLDIGSGAVVAPLDALERRVLSLGLHSPVALLASGLLVSLHEALALDRDVLTAWLSEASPDEIRA